MGDFQFSKNKLRMEIRTEKPAARTFQISNGLGDSRSLAGLGMTRLTRSAGEIHHCFSHKLLLFAKQIDYIVGRNHALEVILVVNNWQGEEIVFVE
jgi:hypothetical protein